MQNTRERVYNFLCQHKGPSPTIRDIAAAVGLSSPATVHTHLKILRERGLITWNEACSRTLQIADTKKAAKK